jgi:hypothetical protein
VTERALPYDEGMHAWRVRRASALVLFSILVATGFADPVPVRRLEGRIHGFLLLRDQEGAIQATGSLLQLLKDNRVTNELRFDFKDGSVHHETSVFSQQRNFRLLSYRLVQQGSAFKQPIDLTVNASTGRVVVRYVEDGKEKTASETMELPPDLANGLVPMLLGNTDWKAAKTMLSMVVATPKPRLVKLEITPGGEDTFTVGGVSQKAMKFVVKIEIGGVSGLIAPLVGKQPPDTYMWMVGGKAPGFLKSEGPLFQGGPIWRIELASPVWGKREQTTKR